MGIRSGVKTLLKGVAVVGVTSTSSFYIWTRRCNWVAIDEGNDSIMSSKFFKKYNPYRNPTLIDVCVRHVELSELPPELVEDARRGGTMLIEKFSASVWGSGGFTPQRWLWGKLFRDLPGRSMQLWEKSDILTSTYDVGDIIVDHLEVVSKSSGSLLFRAGKSQGTAGENLRREDSLLELAVETDFEAGTVGFSIKTAMYQGDSKSEDLEKPMEKVQKLHMWYTNALMESAVSHMRDLS